MVSLKDLAAECGVSVATVSKALHDQDDISEETKKRIKKVADEMGYMPNAAARSLKTKHSRNLGVLYQEETGYGLKHEYFAGVLQGFKNKAESLGYDITFINTNTQSDSMSFLEHCRYRNFDGVVIVCATYDDPMVMELMNSKIPMVTIDYIHHNCTSISSNNTKGIYELVGYAAECGHEKIAYIHGQMHSFVTKERIKAYKMKLEELGIPIREEYIKEAVYKKAEETREKTFELLNLPDPPTCILYPDDSSLIGGLNAINELGLKVPDDISIIGYDGNILSTLLYPTVATVFQDNDLIGSEAAKRLIKEIEKGKKSFVERVVIEGKLIKGQSIRKM